MLCRSGNEFTAQLCVGRQHAVEPNQTETGAGTGRQAFHELQRFHNMSGAVFVRTLQLQHDLAGAITFEPFVGDGRPGDIAAELVVNSLKIDAGLLPTRCRPGGRSCTWASDRW